MKNLVNNKGSSLILLIIIISFTTVLGICMLNISLNHFKIKKSNNELKKAFYLAEDGLNKAYLRVYDLICEASINSTEIADEYLVSYPEDYLGAANIFKNNYKIYVLSNIKTRVYLDSNPYTHVVNNLGLAFIYDKLTIKVNSKYVTNSGIEKNIASNITISVPDYSMVKANEIELISLICFSGFDL